MSRSVEIVFRPVEAIRAVTRTEFCVAGPQVTPHGVAQQLLGERGARGAPRPAGANDMER
jgi:hypothetical protein